MDLQPFVQKYDELTKECAQLADLLKTKSDELLKFRTTTLPDVLKDLGMAEVTFEDGRTLSVKEFVTVKLPETKEPSYDWLAAQGFGALVTCNVAAVLDRSDDAKKVLKATKILKDAKFEVETKQALHPSRLKAWAKDQLKQGATLPADLFEIKTGSIAEIK